MPFNLPFKKSSTSRRPSSPTPRPAISTNGSTCSSASETSSLEAAPMRPPAGSLTLRESEVVENGVMADGHGYAARRGTNGQRSPLQINTSPPTPIHGTSSSSGKQRQDSSTSTLLPPHRASFHSPTNTTFSAPTSRESSVTRSPVTPRARSGAYHTFAQPSTSQALLADPEAQHLFGGLKGSSSGPDLASLRRRAAESRSTNGDGHPGAQTNATDGASARGTSASPRPYEDGLNGKDGAAASTGEGRNAVPRRAVGLQDFVFGEVIGRGSYSTVILATQRATSHTYAIKILDQYQLVQEKKTKYAKVERDALVRLGPMAVHPTRGVAVHPNGVASARGSRRGSEAGEASTANGPTPPGDPSARRGPADGETGLGGAVASMSGRLARLQTRVGGSASMPGLKRAQPSSAGSARTSAEELRKGEPLIGGPIIEGLPRGHGMARRVPSDESSSGTGGHPSPPAVPGQPADTRKPRARPRSAHPGVVRLHYTFKDDTSLYFVLDLAINGELLALIKRHGSLDARSARRYAAQLIDTVEFMHERGVIHRDLKPENILLDDEMRIKVTDFGSAKVLDLAELNKPANGTDSPADDRKRSFVGTAEYVSPEVLRNEHASFPADIWAFGCILFQMLAGRPPFRGGTEYLTFQQVLKAEYEVPEGLDSRARDLIQHVLKLDPAERLDIEGIKAHPYFSDVDFSRIWTDAMPEIRTGIRPPVQPTTRSFAWDELVTFHSFGSQEP